MGWVHFKCVKCDEEFSDFDVSEIELEWLQDNVEQDEYDQYLITCEDCQE